MANSTTKTSSVLSLFVLFGLFKRENAPFRMRAGLFKLAISKEKEMRKTKLARREK
jgi:hypothetical protein